ncbi:MAG: hypothetical protein QOI99_1690 [Actinomycetota bacterium]|nr:hypothetical protein [Actinomycetota bacterium]
MVAVLVATSLAVGACGGDKKPLGPTATVPQATTTTNPYAVPSVIDEAYVNRVLAGLDQAVGDVTRLIVTNQTITSEAADRLAALYTGDALVLKLQGYQRDVLQQFAGYKSPLGNKVTTVTQLISSRPECLFAKVSRDVSAISLNPDPGLSTLWVSLAPLARSRDPSGYNMTGWVFAYEGFQQDLSAPANPCND